MHPNYEFVLDFIARQNGREGLPPRVLDYGCGGGGVVAEGLQRGLDIYGSEVFYAGGDARCQAAATGLLGDRIREMHDGRIPFDDSTFDVVVSNQVFEHVEDLDLALDQIARIMVPGGRLLSMFPSRDVWREGHCGIPFLHRLPPASPWTVHYATLLRRAGLGYHTEGKDPRRWATDFVDWLDRYTYYRSVTDIRRSYARRFDTDAIEPTYAAFRLEHRVGVHVAALVERPFLVAAVRPAIRKLTGLVLVSVRRGS